jgi:hypothetical protein
MYFPCWESNCSSLAVRTIRLVYQLSYLGTKTGQEASNCKTEEIDRGRDAQFFSHEMTNEQLVSFTRFSSFSLVALGEFFFKPPISKFPVHFRSSVSATTICSLFNCPYTVK